MKPTWENIINYSSNYDMTFDSAIISYLNRRDSYELLAKEKIEESETVTNDVLLKTSENIILCEDLSDESYEYLISSIPHSYMSISGIENLTRDKVKLLINKRKLSLTKINFDLLKSKFNDLYHLLVENNISIFLKNINEYDLDSNGIKVLLKSSSIDDSQKLIILNHIDSSIVVDDSELVHLCIDIALGSEVPKQLPLPLVEILLRHEMLPVIDKVKLFNNQSDYLDSSVVISLLNLMDPLISRITANQNPVFDDNETYSTFANKLKQKGIVSTIKPEKDNKIRLHTKRLK